LSAHLEEEQKRYYKNSQWGGNLFRDEAHELRSELAHNIALFIGPAENLATDIRGLTLHRRTALPCRAQ